MPTTVFVQAEFWLLVLFSAVVPTGIYAWLMYKRAISRTTVLLLGILLVAISALDVYLLQIVEGESKLTPSLADDKLFLSEVTLALYLLPLLFAGIGINMISHVLVEHLAEAEKQYDAEQPKRTRIRVRVRQKDGAAPRPKPPLVIDESRGRDG
jgi:hypothetical protein